MIELLQNLWEIMKWFFTDIILVCAKANLGIIGEFKELFGIAAGILLLVAGILKLIRKRTG